MKLEKRMAALEEMGEFLTELFDTDLTVIILNSELGMECISDGFDPDENPEALELFLALILGLAQGAIEQCGKDYKLFLQQDGVMHDYSKILQELEKGLKIKLN